MPRRKENMHIVRRDTWVPPYGWVRRPPVGYGVLQWSAAEQMPLGYDVPLARQRRAALAKIRFLSAI